MAIVELILSSFVFYNACFGMLDQGLPTTDAPAPGLSETTLLHQLIMQESSMRIELEKQIASLQTSVSNIQGELIQKDKDINALKAQNNALQYNLTHRFSQGSTVVFSAWLTHTLVNAPNGKTIIFDKTSINVGNAYSTNTGVFRAPVSGAYQFSLTIGGNVVNTHANMLLNGVLVGHLYADHYRDGLYGRVSLTVALHLSVGDEVWAVDPDGQINQQIIGSSTPLSVFTGHLIAAD